MLSYYACFVQGLHVGTTEGCIYAQCNSVIISHICF